MTSLLVLCGSVLLTPTSVLSIQNSVLPTQPSPAASSAQAATAPGLTEEKPLPDIQALMHAVIARQKSAESAAEDYIYRETVRIEKLDGKDEVKQTELWEQDVFFVDGIQVRKKVSRDGRPLTPAEQEKEDTRVDKEIERARRKRDKADAKDPDIEADLQLSKMLSVGSFTHERREVIQGRQAIVVEFTGDPRAKTRMAIHDMNGTLAVDEQDTAIVSVNGEFIQDFKLLGGLLVKIDKGTKFSLVTTKVRDEVWLPAQFDLQGEARILLLLAGHLRLQVRDSDYRKFKTKSTLVPGFTELNPE